MRKRTKYHRNPIFYLCAILLCLTLLTTCLLCGLLAKYRATGSDDDGARTAEFGQLTLTETTGSTYQVTPGVDITKDPAVSMSASEVAVSVYVDITLSEDWKYSDDNGSSPYTFSYWVDNDEDGTDDLKFMSWTIADGWTCAKVVSNIITGGTNTKTYTFVMELAPGDILSGQSIIKDNIIKVSGDIYYDVYYDTVTSALNALDIVISSRAEQID